MTTQHQFLQASIVFTGAMNDLPAPDVETVVDEVRHGTEPEELDEHDRAALERAGFDDSAIDAAASIGRSKVIEIIEARLNADLSSAYCGKGMPSHADIS